MRGSVRTRLWLFPLLGALFGIVYSFGSATLNIRDALAQGVPLLSLLATYAVCGAIGGLLVALSMPLARWLGGAYVVGALGLAPLYAGVTFVTHTLPTKAFTAIAMGSLMIGGLGGTLQWFRVADRKVKLAHLWAFALISTIAAWAIGLHWKGYWPVTVLAALLFIMPIAVALLGTLRELDRAA